MSKLVGFNVFQAMTNCLAPDIIINPKLPELLYQHNHYFLDGVHHQMSLSPFGVEMFDKRKFLPFYTGVNLGNLNDYFVLDTRSGESFPIYFVVPCGKCDICKDAKRASFARRCQYETQLYDCPPVHITMTYDADHVPSDMSVSKEEVVLWKKLFRVHLERAGYLNKLRMAVAAEYGHFNTLRPHYHVIVWNLAPIEGFDYDSLRLIAYKAWCDSDGVPKCRLERFTFSPITADYVPKGCNRSLRDMGKSSYQAFGYVAKYFYKSDASDVPPGRKPLFHLMSKSKGLGGLGAPFIDHHASRMRKGLHKGYLFLDKWSQTAVEMPYDRYTLNRVFPSRFMSVPYRIRKEFRFVCRYLRNTDDFSLVEKFRPVCRVFESLFPVLMVQKSPSPFCFRSKMSCKLLNKDICRLAVSRSIDFLVEYLPRIDVGNILELDRLRHVVVSKLSVDKKPQDVWRRYQKMCLRRVRRRDEFTVL